MAMAPLHGTATIYQFPAKTRAAAGRQGYGEASVGALPGAFLPRMDFGSGWYHDAAIAEDRQTRQRDDH
jgi:hypothetical protein